MTIYEISALSGAAKQHVEIALGLTSDAMHVHIGIGIYALWTLLLRTRFGDWRPWLLTLAIECVNEGIDLFQPSGSPEANWPASQHDILNTMVAPTLILLTARTLQSKYKK